MHFLNILVSKGKEVRQIWCPFGSIEFGCVDLLDLLLKIKIMGKAFGFDVKALSLFLPICVLLVLHFGSELSWGYDDV